MSALWDSVAATRTETAAELHAPDTAFALSSLSEHSCLAGGLESYRGKCVLLATREQLATAVALVELDGIAGRIVLCTPDLTETQLSGVAATAGADISLTDLQQRRPLSDPRRTTETTEWVLLTSGTTGQPKLVGHTLASLAGTIKPVAAGGRRVVWSTFYDIRRYGGLQIFLRAVLGGTSLVLSSAHEPVDEFFARGARAGVTHISGTPTHWRRALMSGYASLLSPEYVRLSGEVADQGVLDSLKSAYPNARISHAFASTEAGVAFDVDDGRAGFPAAFLENGAAGVDMKVVDGTLRIRSRRNATRYLGERAEPLRLDDGYVDTGDLVELIDGRYFFRGRRGGVINVGGLKVHPEEVESVLNSDPRVRMALVRARRNPLTGAIVVAEVVLADHEGLAADPAAAERLKQELLQVCRRSLPAHKVPATLKFVPALECTAAGKLMRPNA